MLKVTIIFDTDRGEGHIEALVTDEEAKDNFIDMFSQVCEEHYEWHTLTDVVIEEYEGDMTEFEYDSPTLH